MTYRDHDNEKLLITLYDTDVDICKRATCTRLLRVN